MAVTGDVKVGRSSDVDRRIRELQTGCPHRLRLILHLPGEGGVERSIHESFHRYRTRYGKGEWFSEECLAELPPHIYERIPVEVIEDCDWWKSLEWVRPYHH